MTQRIAERAPSGQERAAPLIVALCGAQGSGKSTTTAILKRLLQERGLTVAALTLDDFYLPLADRTRLARDVHPLLKTRGVPGTHDVALALEVLAELHKNGTVVLPLFAKELDDRRPQSEWSRVPAPVQVILLEGWCVGAVPESQESLVQPINALERDEDPNGIWRCYVNEALAKVYAPLYRQINYLILLAAPGFEVVYRWRLDQENDLRRRLEARGSNASGLMSERQLQRFVSHYERLTRHILSEMPPRAHLVVHLDAERRMTIV